MPNRPTHAFKVPAGFTLATADDVNGTNDGTQHLNVSGTSRVLIIQINNGTAGTTGIDAITISKDDGKTWAADPTLLALASDDVSGTAVANGVLNAAGVEPTGAAVFKSGPHLGNVRMRCARLVTDDANSAAWTTGAPQVIAIAVGSSHA